MNVTGPKPSSRYLPRRPTWSRGRPTASSRLGHHRLEGVEGDRHELGQLDAAEVGGEPLGVGLDLGELGHGRLLVLGALADRPEDPVEGGEHGLGVDQRLLIAAQPDAPLDEGLLGVHGAGGDGHGRVPVLHEADLLAVGGAGPEVDHAVVHRQVVDDVALGPVGHHLGDGEGPAGGGVAQVRAGVDLGAEFVDPVQAEIAGHGLLVCRAVWVNGDEDRHPPGPDPAWMEAWWFDAWTPDASIGATTCLVLLPNRARAWYWAALVRPGEPLLVLSDLAVPLPRQGLTIRAEGLWADHTCEAPFEQWTVANEAYALAVDHPDDAVGVPTPFAFDLEWYAGGPATAIEGGYTQAGEVHALVELPGAPLTFDGPAAEATRGAWWPWDEGVRRASRLWPCRLESGVLDLALTPTGWTRWPSRRSF